MNVVIFTDINQPGYLKYAGPYKIATELRNAGYTVQVVDMFTKMSITMLKYILNKIIDKETYWVGFSSTFIGNAMGRVNNQQKSLHHDLVNVLGRDILEVIDYIKSLNSKTRIVVGGAIAGKVSKEPLVDHIVQHQGEVSSVSLTNAIKNNLQFPKIVSDTDFPYNDFTTSTIEYTPQDIIFEGEHLTMEFSRGCIFKCKFCNYPLLGKKLWDFVKPPELIAAEMQRNYDLFKTTGYMVTDDTINDSVEKVEALHKTLIQLPFDLTLSSYARLDLIAAHPHTLDLLYEMGFRNFFFGVESLNHKSAKTIGKGMHPDKIKDTLEYIKHRYPDLAITISLIYGLPYETQQSMTETNEWLKSAPIDYSTISPYFINKNSTIGQDPSAYGYTLNGPMDWKNEFVSWDDCNSLADQGMEICNKRNKLSWTFMNRILNLGFTKDECLTKIYTETQKEIITKTRTANRTYVQSLTRYL